MHKPLRHKETSIWDILHRFSGCVEDEGVHQIWIKNINRNNLYYRQQQDRRCFLITDNLMVTNISNEQNEH